MIDAKELRIGNLLSFCYKTSKGKSHERIVTVLSLGKKSMIVFFNGEYELFYSDTSTVRPITLNGEWLLKFGFTNNGFNSQWLRENVRVALFIEGRTFIYVTDESDHTSRTELFDNTVSGLQNAFRVLKNEELQLKA